ncbi:M57 family metalloprotease [Tenacibaculum agarivorans]|uniref:M57 family metalloprotease n=1 Tax=Tenacibaculum agarivorans TaxID=1908389 RepID=UPI00094B7D08|nr:M57 family metalloprotease [Tenacibaculum agarivorans]
MKKTKKIFLLFAITLITFFSCNKDNTIVQSDNNDSALTASDRSNPVVQKLIAHGTKYEDILESENFFHVKDLLFSKNIEDYQYQDEINTVPNKSITAKQYRSEGLVSLFNLRIKIYLHPSLRNFYLGSLQNAIRRYNNITDCGLFLEYVESRSSASIEVDPKDLGGRDDEQLIIRANAQLPTGGRPGRQMFININSDITETVDVTRTKVELFLHEIGHSIGLKHTNWRSNGEGSYGFVPDLLGISPDEPIHIPDTPSDESDTKSIMWSSIDTGFYGFTNFDLVALRYLYPHAYKFRQITDFYYTEPDGEYELSEDVYADVYTDASYSSRLTLTSSTIINYFLVTENSNASNSAYSRPISQTLAPGRNTYFLRNVYSQCSPYQGEVCTSEYLNCCPVLRN